MLIRLEKEGPIEISVLPYELLGYYRKAIEYYEKDLKVGIGISDRGGEGGAYRNLGNAYKSLGDYGKAGEYHKKTS